MPNKALSAISAIWSGSNGIPRLINSIADRALLGTYATNQSKTTKAIAQQAIKEVIGQPRKTVARPSTYKGLVGSVLAGILILMTAFLLMSSNPQRIPFINETLLRFCLYLI